MRYLLNVVYAGVLLLASPWLLYRAIFHGKYREGFAQKFLGSVPIRDGNRPCVWLHAVSVGEVNLLATLLHEMETRRPDVECVITTSTMTGYALASAKYAPRIVSYCPLDFSWSVKRALRRLRPDLLILAELELWPNLIQAANRQGAKVAIVNGRLSDKSYRGYQRVRRLMGWLLKQLDVIAVQNEEYASRFQSLLGESASQLPSVVRVTGSLKFDGAQADRNNSRTQSLANLAGIAVDDVVFLAGSTQAPEEALALAAYTTLQAEFPKLRLILVPRHPERFEEVAKLLAQSGQRWQRRSELGSTQTRPVFSKPPEVSGSPKTAASLGGLQACSPTEKPRILLVDTIGELGGWWGTSQIAYVGGSMGSRGGQNMIEPAAYGATVSFGPKTANFRDVVSQLLDEQAAVVVSDGDDLTAFVRRCLCEPPFARELGQRARNLTLRQAGATSRTIDMVEPLLPCVDGIRDAA